jgi:hypothetical protein
VHWDHQFSGCKGADAAHSDYWLWFDDKLPGNGGAAALSGDSGLRMLVSGFGIQDYYEGTGSKPKGGSIMIVGSSSSQAPTRGDIWLLKRTWKEMQKLRSW